MRSNIKKLAKTLLVTTSLATLAFGGAINSSVAHDLMPGNMMNSDMMQGKSCMKSGQHCIKSDFEIKLNAYANFQGGYRTQSNLTGDAEKNVSANRKTMAFYNDTALTFTAMKNTDELTYGLKIVLTPTAKMKNDITPYNGSHIFVESSFGRVELGSPIDASATMHTDGFNIIAGAGTDFWTFVKFSPSAMNQTAAVAAANNGSGITVDGVAFTSNVSTPAFIFYPEFFLNDRLATLSGSSNEPSRAVSYYTPKLELSSGTKLQMGLTYVPDSSNTGAGNTDENSSTFSNKTWILTTDAQGNPAESFDINAAVKDAFTGGVSLEQNLSDGVDLKLALTGEYGKAAGKATRTSANATLNDKEYKLENLKTYNIGGILNFGNFSLAGSYGSRGKSLTHKDIYRTGQNVDFYTATVAYKYGPFNTSLSYFKSNHYKNSTDYFAVGANYKMAPGLMPYAEVVSLNLKGRPEYFPELQKKKSKATIVLLGLKLNI